MPVVTGGGRVTWWGETGERTEGRVRQRQGSTRALEGREKEAPPQTDHTQTRGAENTAAGSQGWPLSGSMRDSGPICPGGRATQASSAQVPGASLG